MWVCIGYTSNVKVLAVIRMLGLLFQERLGLPFAKQSQFQPVPMASLVALADKMGATWEKVFTKRKNLRWQ